MICVLVITERPKGCDRVTTAVVSTFVCDVFLPGPLVGAVVSIFWS